MAAVQSNQILASLSADQLRRLARHLHSISLPAGKVLYEPGEVAAYAYFLDSGLASETAVLGEVGLEVSVIGNEGLVGIPSLLKHRSHNTRCTMVLDGQGRLILAKQLNNELQGLNELFHCYLQSRFLQMSQLALCAHFHPIEPKLARWLAMAADYTELSRFTITHESLAFALGVRRSTLTIAAGELQRRGMVECNRGSIEITNRPKLEDAACECYFILRQERSSFLSR